MKKLLVTGADGFIGSALSSSILFNENYSVFTCGEKNRLDSHYYHVDLTDYCETQKILQLINPDIIVHCAGSANVPFSVEHPEQDFELNVKITNNLLTAWLKCDNKEKELVFLSSAAVYGNQLNTPIFETAIHSPVSPYAIHKQLCELLCSYYSKQNNIDIRIARIFSAYGPGLKKQIFWDLYNKYKETGLLELLGSGEETRDYIYIDDLVNALFLITSSPRTEDPNIFNVGNGNAIAIKDVAQIFASNLGKTNEIIHFAESARSCDPTNFCAANQKLIDLGYHQQVAIKDGIKKYIEWVCHGE